jgi:putative ABC transport system permease protein
VIVLTATTIGIIMLVGIDGRTIEGDVPDSGLITMLNYVVTGMLALFAAIMVLNATAAMMAHRRTELSRLRLLGASPAQVRSSVLAEAGIVAAVGIVLGAVASLATVLPFAYARGEGVLPDGQWWLPPTVAAGVAALTLLAAQAAVAKVPMRAGA